MSRKALRFFIDRPARVYVAYKTGAARLPGWLGRSSSARTCRSRSCEWEVKLHYQVYGKDFPAGKVMLGGNHAP